MMTALRVLTVVIATFLISACNWYPKGGHNQQQGVWIEGGVSGTFLQGGPGIGAFNEGGPLMKTFNAAEVALVLESAGTHIPNSTGTGIATLKSGSTVLSSQAFDYVIDNGVAIPSNPAVLEYWASNYPQADDFSFRLNNIQNVPSAEQAAITGTTVYSGEPVASTTVSWGTGRGGGGGCDICVIR